jgi:hypothetical protein
MANLLIRLMFGIKLNDTTNAFKACRTSRSFFGVLTEFMARTI